MFKKYGTADTEKIVIEIAQMIELKVDNYRNVNIS